MKKRKRQSHYKMITVFCFTNLIKISLRMPAMIKDDDDDDDLVDSLIAPHHIKIEDNI